MFRNNFFVAGATAACVYFSALQIESHAADLLDVSSFMMAPRTSWANINSSADPNVSISERLADSHLGFRVIHLREGVKGKQQAAIDLALSGIVETGDILLSFRPLWDNTLAYAHMQLGVSHSAIAFIVAENEKKFVMTLESPISYSSPLNYPEHYADLDAIHVIRPPLDTTQKKNLEKWARLILSKKTKFSFFQDYSSPMYTRGISDVATPKDQIKQLARVSLGTTSDEFSSFCSEFVWSLLGLRNCSPSSFSDSCITPIFSTDDGMLTGVVPKLNGNAGLIQGPEAALTEAKFSDTDKVAALIDRVFVDVLTNEAQLAGRMSSGHIRVAIDNRSNMKNINDYYRFGEPTPIADQLNHSISSNVSPTAFLVRSNAGMDGLRYVGTVIFDK